MKRFKNYALWVAIAAVVGMALVDFGVVPDTTVFNGYVEKILYVLILAGVINNPSSGSGFKDE
ncbi:holin [Niallia circulans]|uniref:holin n=1 Tax=Niallia circulans TaxID=1397 RepID=UPI001560155C|nr:holin [Niallia circulans]NRG30687.1 holin [Niallia circulans]